MEHTLPLNTYIQTKHNLANPTIVRNHTDSAQSRTRSRLRSRLLYSAKFTCSNGTTLQVQRNQEQVFRATRCEGEKASNRKTAAAYGIPYTTLHDHLSGKSKKRYGGPPTALSYEEDKEIVQRCVVLQEIRFPVDRSSLTSVVSDYIKATGKASPFKYDSQGPDWFSQFMRRWKTVLSLRKPQHLSRKRAKALTSDRVGKWMEFVEQVYRNLGFFK